MGARCVRAWLGLIVLSALQLLPSAGHAATRIGVRVFGAPAATAAPLAQALRDAIVEGGVALVSSEALREAEQQLGISKAERESEAALLRGAAEAQATHLLVVRLTRKGRRFQAKIEFFDVTTSALRSKGSLRWDRSKASAQRLAGPLIGALLKKSEPEPSPEPAPETAPDPVIEAETSTSTPTASKPEPEAEPEPEPEPSPPPAPAAVPAPVAAPAPARRSSETWPVRFTLSAGTTLLRNYRLSTAANAASDLSHALLASALFAAEMEIRWPWTQLGLWTRAWFSPVRYQVTVAGVLREQPAGYLFEADGQLRLHLRLSERTSLMPGLGVRLGLTHVEPHRGNFIVSQQSFAPAASLGFRFEPQATLELSAGLSGGYLLSFDESPVGSGAPGPGFVGAADLSARWWLAGALGLAFDARLDLLHLGFDGSADRQAPEGESIVASSLTTLDLRLQLGVALRL